MRVIAKSPFYPHTHRVYYHVSDRLVGKIFLTCILIYIGLYALFVSKGFHVGQFNPTYLTIIIPIFLIDSIKTFIESLARSKFYQGKQDLSKVTVIIPTYNGGADLQKTLDDILKRFPSNQVIVSSNGSKDTTVPDSMKRGVVVVDTPQPIGKVEAINVALKHVQTPYCLIMDDDVLIKNAIIPTSLLDEGYSGVAFRVFPIVTNFVTKIQDYEYKKSMDIGRRFHNHQATVQNISGAIGLYTHKELLRQTNIHTGEFSGEDLQRTLLVHLQKPRKGVVISDSIVQTDVPQTLSSLFWQRVIGWYPGLFSNIGNYLKLLVDPKSNPYLKYDAFYNLCLVIAGDMIRLTFLPVIVLYPWYFLVMCVIYIGLESLAWLRLSNRGPYWVVLIYPLYGLMGFLTRITALAVFIYRRSVVIHQRLPKLDDYRHAYIVNRFYATAFSLSLMLILLGVVLLFRFRF